MIKVQVRSNESLEAALRRFKHLCNYSGVFRMAKARTWHEKRSDEMRRERRERLRTIQRATRIVSFIASLDPRLATAAAPSSSGSSWCRPPCTLRRARRRCRS